MSSCTEPQWFPRPITDSFESSLDALERQEEDRKNRLTNIANVSARIPIGLGAGAPGAGSDGSVGTPGNGSVIGGGGSSVRGPSSIARSGSQPYARHRYYPPPSPTSTSLYSRGGNNSNDGRYMTMATPPALASARRIRHYRRTNTPRSAASPSSAYSGATASYSRNVAFMDASRNSAFSAVDGDGGGGDYDGISMVGSETPGVVGATANTSQDNESFGATSASFLGVSSPLFQSPLAAGGGGHSPWHSHYQEQRHQHHEEEEGAEVEEFTQQQQQMSYYSQEYQRNRYSQFEAASTPREATTSTMTPPPINPMSAGRHVDSRDGQSRGYGQRRSRRRGWEEANDS